jgi:hypothetical protein
MKFYIVIADVNGTVLKSKYRNSDQAFARASAYRAQGHRAIIKVVENGEILN